VSGGATEPEGGRAAAWSTAAIAGAALLLAAIGLAADRIVDDTFITLRYSRNWAEGHGPVFNPGERVEGYTNFLWMALLAAIHAVAPALDLARAAQAMGLLSGAGVVLLAGFAARRRLGPAAGAAVALLLALHSPLAAWSVSGLETPLVTLLVLAAWACETAGPARPRAPLATPQRLALAT
jgi:arabinofuranosyltransferase